MSSTIYTISSALGALAGLAYLAQGIRAGWGSAAGRDQVMQGATIALMIGSNLLPETLHALRDALVVAGCLLFLASLWLRRRIEVPGAPGAP